MDKAQVLPHDARAYIPKLNVPIGTRTHEHRVRSSSPNGDDLLSDGSKGCV